MKKQSKKEKTYFQLRKVGNKYMWTGTYKTHPDHHIESDDRYFYTTDPITRDEMNGKPVNK